MTKDELEIKRFELEQQVQIEELELKKKELDLKIQEQKGKTIFTPLLITIVGGLVTLITGIVLKYFESQATNQLEDKKFQSSLLLKATEAENYDEFSDMLLVFKENGLLSLDSTKIQNFRRKRFIAAEFKKSQLAQQQKQQHTRTDSAVNKGDKFYWTVVAGGDANLKGAKFEQTKSLNKGFKNVDIWFHKKSFRTCIGKYSTYDSALIDLFEIKDKISNSSFVVRFDEWCPRFTYDPTQKIYICQ
jgi:hypothetical protein